MKIGSVLAIAAGVVAGLCFLQHTASAGFKELSGTHSRSEVLQACQSSGGNFYNNDGGYGSYGCTTDKGNVNCNDKGKCTGNCGNCSGSPIKLKTAPIRTIAPTKVSNPGNPHPKGTLPGRVQDPPTKLKSTSDTGGRRNHY